MIRNNRNYSLSHNHKQTITNIYVRKIWNYNYADSTQYLRSEFRDLELVVLYLYYGLLTIPNVLVL